MALGAPGSATACLPAIAPVLRTAKLRGLGHLAGPQAPRADANPPHGAIDNGFHTLEVRFESPRPDVMSVGDRSTDDRTLAADFASLCPDCRVLGGGPK